MAKKAVSLEIKGLNKIIAKMNKFPFEVGKMFIAAGREAAKDVVLPTEGLQDYPPTTAANQPPAPYYKRNVGTETASGNLMNSEQLGKQWFVKRKGIDMRIFNRASYAKWVHGEEDQATAMAKIGWKKLLDVAKNKLPAIQRVYQAWVNTTLKKLRLK